MKWKFLGPEQGYNRIRVEADWEEMISDYNDIVDGYKNAPVPGFRAGKAPRKVIEKQFQAEITDDLSRVCAQRFGHEAIRQSGLEPAGALEVFEIECVKGKPLRFVTRFIPLPDFDVPDLSSIQLPGTSEDPLSGVSQWLLELVGMRLPDELVRTELAFDGMYTSEPKSKEWADAEERVKLMLILKKIASREGIEVDDLDVEARIKAKASEFGMNVKELRAELKKGLGRERLRDMLIAESTLEYLLEISRRIAREGVMFTDYYGEQSCTAGRSSFITGQAGLRTGLTKVGLPGADLGLKTRDVTIAELLKVQGYATGQFGKNHLGDKDEHLPTNHGFDEFYGNLYHLNAEEEPELPDYPKESEFPGFRKSSARAA